MLRLSPLDYGQWRKNVAGDLVVLCVISDVELQSKQLWLI